jgi:hypothetical protein
MTCTPLWSPPAQEARGGRGGTPGTDTLFRLNDEDAAGMMNSTVRSFGSSPPPRWAPTSRSRAPMPSQSSSPNWEGPSSSHHTRSQASGRSACSRTQSWPSSMSYSQSRQHTKKPGPACRCRPGLGTPGCQLSHASDCWLRHAALAAEWSELSWVPRGGRVVVQMPRPRGRRPTASVVSPTPSGVDRGAGTAQNWKCDTRAELIRRIGRPVTADGAVTFRSRGCSARKGKYPHG